MGRGERKEKERRLADRESKVVRKVEKLREVVFVIFFSP